MKLHVLLQNCETTIRYSTFKPDQIGQQPVLRYFKDGIERSANGFSVTGSSFTKPWGVLNIERTWRLFGKVLYTCKTNSL